MAHEVWDRYGVELPLTGDEQRWLETLSTLAQYAGLAQEIAAAGVTVKSNDAGERFVAIKGRARSQFRYLLEKSLAQVHKPLLWAGENEFRARPGTLPSPPGIHPEDGPIAAGCCAFALRLGIAALGPEHPATLSCAIDLAQHFRRAGRFDEALTLSKHLASMIDRVLLPTHPLALASREDLARCLNSSGNASATRDGVPGADHADAAREMDGAAAHATVDGPHAQVLLPSARADGIADSDSLASLDTSAAHLQLLGRLHEALPLWERALEARERLLGPYHRDALSAAEKVADCQLALGRQAAALATYRRCHAGAERSLGTDDVVRLSVANSLVESLLEQDGAAEALPICRQLVERRKRVLGEAHAATLASVNNLAVCYGNLGRADEALPLLKRVLDGRLGRSAGPPDGGLMRSMSNYGGALVRLSRQQEALPWLERAVEIAESVYGREDRMLCEPLNLLGDCQLRLLRIDEALRCFERAIAISEARVGSDHSQTLLYMNNRASCLGSLQRWDEAVAAHREVAQRCQRAHGEDSTLALSSQHGLAHCLSKVGRTSEALATWITVRNGQVRVLGRSHRQTLMTSTRIAMCLEQQGDANGAASAWREVVDSLVERPSLEEVWVQTLSVAALNMHSGAARGDPVDCDRQMLRMTRAFAQCLDLTSAAQLARWRGMASLLFDTHLRLCLDHGRLESVPGVLAMRQGRKLTALVLDELETRTSELEPDSPRARLQALRIELRRLSFSLQANDAALEQRAGHPTDRAARDAGTLDTRQRELSRAYATKLDEYEALREELARTESGFTVTAKALSVSMPELQARLGPQEALLLLFERQDPHARLGLLITPSAALLVPLVDEALAQAGVLSTRWSQMLHSRSGMRRAVMLDSEAAPLNEPEEAPATHLDHLGALLREGLWASMAKHIGRLQRLHVVTHGSFHLLPLQCGAPDGLELCTYPGFIYYQRVRHQEAQPSAAPDATGALGIAVHAADDTPGLMAIPLVHAEARIVQALWPGAVHADPDLAQPDPPLTVLQLAGHGQVNPKDPARANLMLAAGALDLNAVLSAQQHPAVVVLSACTVGRTADDPDGEPLGLVGGFMLRGARQVIASLQPVPDFYMPLLMALFYRSWRDGMTPAQALADAKRRLSSGRWHADTAELIRSHYREALVAGMNHALRQPAQPLDPLLILSHAWLFPAPFRGLHPRRDAQLLAELKRRLSNGAGRWNMAQAIAQCLIDERAQLPRHQVETLCTWVVAFGDEQ